MAYVQRGSTYSPTTRVLGVL